ncbi:MAG: helix-turn-helix domain-containing protein [Pseudomonadota bacterium]
MAKTRSYKLLCPIARALDRIGDRWTLLILRDLHAGPARFSELQRGLTGVAANLLTERLAKLVKDGLIAQQETDYGVMVYALTDMGTRTSDIILELAMFGGQFKPETEIVEPGNLRTVVTTLGAAARRVATPEMTFSAVLDVDWQRMHLIVDAGSVTPGFGDLESSDLVFTAAYKALLALTEGEMDLATFQAKHAKLETESSEKAAQFLGLMTRIVELLQG